MKTVIKLMIAAAVLNASARAGLAAWRYYQFKDASYHIALFSGNASEGDLYDRVLEKAAEYEVPITSEQIVVQRDGQRTLISAEYDQRVEFFPKYDRSVKMSFSVEAYSTRPMTASDAVR